MREKKTLRPVKSVNSLFSLACSMTLAVTTSNQEPKQTYRNAIEFAVRTAE